MTTRTGGSRKGTRHTLSKKPRQQGKLTITQLLKSFKVGDRVRVRPEPAIQRGMPHHRMFNKVGTVTKMKGKAYIVEVKDGNKTKELIVNPIHLVKI
jgi:large subunit ribosomal protein L21e|tara:strand:- start:231 stop:521 length:291 start_codon:yes stop_codon:yes gene_type:complete